MERWESDKPCLEDMEGSEIDGAERVFNDRQHILYVNASYKGEGPNGDLMHDFLCSDPDEMKTESRVLKTS